jgi:hypothetical protein
VRDQRKIRKLGFSNRHVHFVDGLTYSANSVAYRVLAYTLDNVGNRTAVADGGVATNYTYDAVNELLTAQ